MRGAADARGTRDAVATNVAGVQFALLLVVAGVCALIGLLGTPREHGLVTPAAIGIGAGLLGATLASVLELPFILPIGIGALVCPAIWAVVGSAILVGALRFVWVPRGEVR